MKLLLYKDGCYSSTKKEYDFMSPVEAAYQYLLDAECSEETDIVVVALDEDALSHGRDKWFFDAEENQHYQLIRGVPQISWNVHRVASFTY